MTITEEMQQAILALPDRIEATIIGRRGYLPGLC